MSQYIRTISRRSLLKGLGGSALFFLPLLKNMRAAAQGQVPKFFVVLHTPYGLHRTSNDSGWGAKTGATRYNFNLKTGLAPFESLKNQLSIIEGLNMNNAGPPNFNRHVIGNTYLLTGKPIPGAEGAGVSGGPCIDLYLADKLKPQTYVKNLRVQTKDEEDEDGSIFFDSLNKSTNGISNPQIAFNEVFSPLLIGGGGTGGSGGGSDASLAARLAARGSILDFVTEDLDRIRKQVSVSETVKIDEHLTAIRDLEIKLGFQSGATPVPSINLDVCQNPSNYIPQSITSDGRSQAGIVSQLNLEVIARGMACGLVNISACRLRAPNLTELNATIVHHLASHLLQANPTSEADLLKYDLWHSQTIANFAQMLDSFMLADGKSLLHHSAVAWMTEVGTGSSHQQTNMPITLLGSAGGALKPGQYLNFNAQKKTSDLLLALAQAMGVNESTFGDSNTPLTEVLNG